MAQVQVTIAGRTYRMACGEGEEDHLSALAARLDARIGSLRGDFGEIGDNRITVMAAITMADDLTEAERRIAALEAEATAASHERHQADRRITALERAVAAAIDDVTAGLDKATRDLVEGDA